MSHNDDDDGGWRAMHAFFVERSKQKRASNRQSSATILETRGISFVAKNEGAHLIVQHEGMTIDFWPGTGRWKVRDPVDGGFGVFNLLKHLRLK